MKYLTILTVLLISEISYAQSAIPHSRSQLINRGPGLFLDPLTGQYLRTSHNGLSIEHYGRRRRRHRYVHQPWPAAQYSEISKYGLNDYSLGAELPYRAPIATQFYIEGHYMVISPRGSINPQPFLARE